MSKERELLRRVIDIIEENPTQADEYAINLIEAFLAQPEPKREPLDPFKVVQEFEGDYIYKDGFIDGIKYAEKAHGIGVDL